MNQFVCFIFFIIFGCVIAAVAITIMIMILVIRLLVRLIIRRRFRSLSHNPAALATLPLLIIRTTSIMYNYCWIAVWNRQVLLHLNWSTKCHLLSKVLANEGNWMKVIETIKVNWMRQENEIDGSVTSNYCNNRIKWTKTKRKWERGGGEKEKHIKIVV